MTGKLGKPGNNRKRPDKNAPGKTIRWAWPCILLTSAIVLGRSGGIWHINDPPTQFAGMTPLLDPVLN